MVYRVIGLMSGSSLDGLDICYSEFQETAGRWSYEMKASACYPYEPEMKDALKNAPSLPALEYQLLHTQFGHYMASQVKKFIQEFSLEYKVQLIASHGHTAFHAPEKKMTAQLGDGAAIAASTGINVVSDLRAMDVALGGHGAPIVPVGEKLLFTDYDFFLNIGGIANLSFNGPEHYIAFDVCPANRVMNLLAAIEGLDFDPEGGLAAKGKILPALLSSLNELEYYHHPYPKSLANFFGTDVVFPLLKGTGSTEDLLRTFTEHVAIQVSNSVRSVLNDFSLGMESRKIMITGGGAHNVFLVERIRELLQPMNVTVVVPEKELVDFKEAVVMGLIGILRWREENNVFASVTGASRNSIGGAVWIGQEA